MEYGQLTNTIEKLNIISNVNMAGVAVTATYSNIVMNNLTESDEQLQEIASQLNVQENDVKELGQSVFSLSRRHIEEQHESRWVQRVESEWTDFVKRFD